MRIALTQRVISNYSSGERRDALSQEWQELFERLIPGSTVVPAPNIGESIVDWFKELDFEAVVLTGGDDWGDTPERDETETAILTQSREMGLPVLGVCRGMQVVNMFYGGDVARPHSGEGGLSHVRESHVVSIEDPIDMDNFIHFSITISRFRRDSL